MSAGFNSIQSLPPIIHIFHVKCGSLNVVLYDIGLIYWF